MLLEPEKNLGEWGFASMLPLKLIPGLFHKPHKFQMMNSL